MQHKLNIAPSQNSNRQELTLQAILQVAQLNRLVMLQASVAIGAPFKFYYSSFHKTLSAIFTVSAKLMIILEF